jgi:PPOX class probable F420-dependent enzyme
VNGSRSITLDDGVRALFDGRNFATIATLNPDGSPQSSLVWIGREGDQLVFSAMRHRRKVRNLERDPRVSVNAYELGNPYHSVEVRGRATIEADPDGRLNDELSRKYDGKDADEDPPGRERVIVTITPERVNEFAG